MLKILAVTGAVLATIPIAWSGRAPTLADLNVEKVDLVDVDANKAPEGIELLLAVGE